MKKYIAAILNIAEVIVVAVSVAVAYLLFRWCVLWLSDNRDCANVRNAALIFGSLWIALLIAFDIITAHNAKYEGITRKERGGES